MHDVLLPTAYSLQSGWMCEVLLPSTHSLHRQCGCEMSYFPVLTDYTHRMDVWCLTSQFSLTTHTGWMCDVLLPSTHSLHTKWMCDVLLPSDHSLHAQGGCVMSYFPALIHYTHNVDVRCLTSQFLLTTHTGWRHDVSLTHTHTHTHTHTQRERERERERVCAWCYTDWHWRPTLSHKVEFFHFLNV